jgi:two-component system, NtrC family, response regulator HydG
MSFTNVLVVDDDIAVCRIVHRMLSDDRCKVQISQSVASAHDAIEQTPFDVYVLDYKLPDGSGLDVAEWIRLKRGAAPIIFMSGYDPSAVALRAEELCIADFLKKPFSHDTLCDAVKKVFSSPPAAQASVPPSQETEKKQQNLISRFPSRF